MKLYAPTYYKSFKCIADRCEHSCCIGWEICVDVEALGKYESLDGGYGDVIKKSVSYEGEPHFKLHSDERCPHLDEMGLCKIILNLGEGYLCDICREHPRFYNYTDVAEVGLGMSCPEAARVILSSADYQAFYEIGEVDADGEKLDFNGRSERSAVYEILSNASITYRERLKAIYTKYAIPEREDGYWHELIGELEYLDENHRELFMHYSAAHSHNTSEIYAERFLAYLIYRHCTESEDIADFSMRLGFCLFCQRLLSSLINSQKANSLSEISNLASIISEEIEYSEDNTFTLTY